MATSKMQTSPVNLKERIAALQQRHVSPTLHQSAQTASRSIPASGTGALRDKIAKFEEKGGVPVPRGSFAMGAPQLAENAPAKKRGELYGNRMQGLGRPSGPPISRAGSPAPVPTTGEPLTPRKRCVSTGGALSSAPPSFTTDEPVPALPSNLPGSAPRRNSLAVDFGPGRRVVSTGDADGKAAELAESYSPSPLSASSEKSFDSSLPPPDTAESSSPTADVSQSQNTVEVSSLEAEKLELTNTELTVDASDTPELSSALEEEASPTEDEEELPAEEEVTPTEEEVVPTEEEATLTEEEAPPTEEEAMPTEEEASPTVMNTSEVEAPGIEDPAPSIDGTLSVNESSPKVTQSHDIEESIMDGVPDYEPALQSAVSQSSPVLVIPESASPITPSGPFDVAFVAHQSPSVPTEKGPIPTNSTSSPPEKTVIPTVVSTCEAGGTISITVPNPKVPVPSSAPETGIHSEGKRSFKAVVHRKVTEKPAVTVPASTLVAPPTPQVVRPRRSANSNVVEVPASPGGYGDLAVLLEDAALLEMRLTEGDDVRSKAGGLLPPTPTSAIFMPDPRSASASTLTGHAPMTSTDSGSQSGRSVSIPSIREPEVDGEIPEEDEMDGRSLASTTFSQRSPSHRKYLSSIRRLTGRRSSSYMPGAYPRDSMSMSSEDSSPVATPPDSGNGRAFGIAWPSGSPKRSGSGASRASSFADKIFHRNRTRSNVSTADPDRSSLYESSQPNLTLSFSPDVSPEKHRDGTDVSARPSSWISPRDSSSDFSPASSFLDKDIFDAFPSVPQTLPPGPLYLDPGSAGVGRAATLPVKGRKHNNQRLSMM